MPANAVLVRVPRTSSVTSTNEIRLVAYTTESTTKAWNRRENLAYRRGSRGLPGWTGVLGSSDGSDPMYNPRVNAACPPKRLAKQLQAIMATLAPTYASFVWPQ
jgi:hypothetical protein